MADQPVRLRITGLAPHDEITVASGATDYQGARWQAQAVFRADAHGVVALDTAPPVSGAYQGADGMGLFWSMNPPSGDPDQASFGPRIPQAQSSYEVQISVTAHGRQLATRALTRQWLADGVTAKEFTPAADKVAGELFLPPVGSARHPAVLVFGGSEGGVGIDQMYTAALLASRGYPALALGYFNVPGLPATLSDIPLEYFATAARLLAAAPGADPAQVVAMGYSYGSEAALLLAEDYPELIHGVVAYSPSSQVTRAVSPAGGDAWTKDGKPVAPGLIPLDRIGGPVLAVAGSDDRLWGSADSARQIGQELDAAHDPHPHQALVYPGAGHGVGIFPFLAAGTRAFHPITRQTLDLGGTRPANAAAKEAGWPKVLALLAGLQR